MKEESQVAASKYINMLNVASVTKFCISSSGCFTRFNLMFLCFPPQAQSGLQGDGGKKKGGEKRRSQRNKTVRS